jgi:hypothetical protein
MIVFHSAATSDADPGSARNESWGALTWIKAPRSLTAANKDQHRDLRI